jgi:hypothetical protein
MSEAAAGSEKVETPLKEEQKPSHAVKVRVSKLRESDIAAISDPDRAKNFATNQGVQGYTDRSLGNSEIAISQAMGEVAAQFHARLQEVTSQLEILKAAFEQLARIQSGQITQALLRLETLELRWWERLWQDLEWDWYGFVDWYCDLFHISRMDVTLDSPQDPALVLLDNYLQKDPHPDDAIDEAEPSARALALVKDEDESKETTGA